MRGPSESKSASQNSNNSRRSHLKRRMSIWFRPLLLPSSVRAHCSFANIPLHDIVKTIPPNRITGATLLNYLLTHCSAALIHNNWEYWHWWQRGTGFNRNILCIAPEGILIITWFKKFAFANNVLACYFVKFTNVCQNIWWQLLFYMGFFVYLHFFFLYILSSWENRTNLQFRSQSKGKAKWTGIRETTGSKQQIREQLYCRLIPQTSFTGTCKQANQTARFKF